MLNKLKTQKGFNLSAIATQAKVNKHKLIFAISEYEGRRKSSLSEIDEKKILRVLKKMHKTLSEIIEVYE